MELWELVARERCRDTLAQYTHAGDRFLLDEYVSAFCEDGVLEVRGAEPLVGRAAILERFRARHRQAGVAQRGPVGRRGPSASSATT